MERFGYSGPDPFGGVLEKSDARQVSGHELGKMLYRLVKLQESAEGLNSPELYRLQRLVGGRIREFHLALQKYLDSKASTK